MECSTDLDPPILRERFVELAEKAFDDPREPIERFENEGYLIKWWVAASTTAFVWMFISVVFLWVRRFYCWPPSYAAHPWVELMAALIVSSWAIGPAAWFSYETSLLKARDVETKARRIERWRIGSSAGKAFWIAIGTLMAGLYIEWKS